MYHGRNTRCRRRPGGTRTPAPDPPRPHVPRARLNVPQDFNCIKTYRPRRAHQMVRAKTRAPYGARVLAPTRTSKKQLNSALLGPTAHNINCTCSQSTALHLYIYFETDDRENRCVDPLSSHLPGSALLEPGDQS